MLRNIGLMGAAALVAVPSPALAQQAATRPAQASGLEEIVVTAERRTENLQNVPVTVTAVSADQMTASGITNIQSLANIVPSLSVIDPTGYTMSFIRGVGSSTLGSGTFSSTAIYIDGVYIARTTNALFELDSVESVQVLAGPQGALYGRNATAGAIVITTEKPEPGDEFNGNVSASFGNYDFRSFSGKIAGGIGEDFAVLLAAAKHDRDGYVETLGAQLHDEDMDDRDSLSASATLVYEPSDNVSIALRGAYTESNDRMSGGYEAVGQNVPGPVPGLNDNQSAVGGSIGGLITGQLIGQGVDPATAAALGGQVGFEAGSNAVFSSEFAASYDNQTDGFTNGLLHGEHKGGSSLYIENTLLSLNADFEFDAFTLRSVTGYTDSDYHGSVQVGLESPGSATSATLGFLLGAPGPVPINANGGLGFSSINPSEVFSQGFQFLSDESSDLTWIAGVDYSKEDGQSVLTGDFFGASLYSADNEWSVSSVAGYGQVTIPFASNWSATLGGRYTDEEYEIDDHIDPTDSQTLPTVVNVGSIKQASDKFTYTARLEYQAEDWLAYGGIATGFKSATLNPNSPAQGRSDPEEVESIEIGFKRDFADQYRLNASAYYATYEGIQLNVIEQATGANFLTNGPDAEVTGLDLQAVARVTDNFQLTAGATILDAKFTESTPALQIDGNRLPGAAEFAASLIGDLYIPFATAGSMNLTATLVYNSGMFYEHLNLTGSGGATDDSYGLVNLNLTYRSPNERWTASVWGNNVFDEEYYRTGIIAFGTFGRAAIAGNPQTYGATLTVSF